MIGSGFIAVESSTGHKKPKYYLYLCKAIEIRDLLKQILSYLVLKRRHAELMLEFLSYRFRPNKRGYLKREWEIYEELRRLNKRGNEATVSKGNKRHIFA